MRRFTSWQYVLIVLALCVFLFSGCGGGSSGNGYYIPTEPDNTTPEPDNPSEPEPEPEPIPVTEYDITTMIGDWEGRNGSGSATGADGRFDLELVFARASVNDINMTGETGTAYVNAEINWDVFQNGSYVRTIEQRWYSKQVDLVNVGTNTWRFSFSDTTSRLTIQLTSDSTATVTEEGTTWFGYYNYQYSGSYNLKKLQ